MRPPSDHIRRFVDAIKSDRLDLGGAAGRSGLAFHEAAEVWAYGFKAGKLRFVDNGSGQRWIEVCNDGKNDGRPA